MSETVHVTVDPHVCVGVGACEELQPTVFDFDEFEGLTAARPGVSLSRVEAEAAVVACPSGAISIVEDGISR